MPGLSCMHQYIFTAGCRLGVEQRRKLHGGPRRSKIKQPPPEPCRAATQIARTHPVPSACSSSLEASLARASWGQPASIGRRPTALGTLAFRILRGHRGVSGGRRPSPFQWASGWKQTNAHPSSALSTISGATGTYRLLRMPRLPFPARLTKVSFLGILTGTHEGRSTVPYQGVT